ncbi:MAG: inosine-5-monophosphate dehydrogenase [Burkholderiaceae bacterium]|nr:inosine-5-monophosphate dehydrogenase [Burkholderiaceae bacterium]
MKKISEVMTSEVQVVQPDDTVQDAAAMMAEQDVGALPVCDGSRLQGMITDRDIAVRAVANGRDSDTPVREVMSEDVIWCSEDDDTQDVLGRMGDRQIRRIPVVDANRNLVGIVSLGDLAIEDEENVDEALRSISMPA